MLRRAHCRVPCITHKTHRNPIVPCISKRNFAITTSTLSVAAPIVGAVALGAFTAYRYKVAGPDEYLVRTGLGIKDISIAKQGWLWPFQKYSYISMVPTNYTFSLNSMSQEKIPFVLPGVFTIGPKNDVNALTNYVRTIGNGANISTIVLGILEGETRVLSSKMAIEQIFNDRQAFKNTIISNVQEELDKFGLLIYNANIQELLDSTDSRYFFNMRQKKSSEAENEAKVHVSEATKMGDIGKKEREAETRQRNAQLEAESVLRENERQQEIEKSKAALEVVKSEAFRLRTLADIEALCATQARETDLQREVEQKRIAMETEKMRAVEMVKAQVHAEAQIKESEGMAQSIKLKADADLYAKQAEAQGVQSLLDAQASGLRNIVNTFNGDTDAFTRYLMVKERVYVDIARENALAIKGLQPKIVQWNTGSDQKNAITDILKLIPPVFSTIHDQTGIKPPGWLMQMPESVTEIPKNTNLGDKV